MVYRDNIDMLVNIEHTLPFINKYPPYIIAKQINFLAFLPFHCKISDFINGFIKDITSDLKSKCLAHLGGKRNFFPKNLQILENFKSSVSGIKRQGFAI